MRGLKGLLLLAAVGVLSCFSTATATTVTFDAAGLASPIIRMGADGSYEPTVYDKLTVNPGSGSFDASALAAGIVVDLNPISFEAGPNSYGTPTASGSFSQALTITFIGIDNQTKTLTQQWNIAIAYSDTLTITGSPLYFDVLDLTVTPKAKTLVSSGGIQNTYLQAEFKGSVPLASAPPVPLPAAAWMGMAMIGGLGTLRAMRRKSEL